MKSLRRLGFPLAIVLTLLALGSIVCGQDSVPGVRIETGVSGHIHPALCISKKGTLVAVYCKSEYRPYLIARSTDGGKSWSRPELFPHTVKTDVYPGSLTTLADGRLLHAWNVWYSVGEKLKSRYVAFSISSDDGVTWSEPKSLAKTDQKTGSVIRHPIVELGPRAWLFSLMDRTIVYDPETGAEKPFGDGRNHGLVPIVRTAKGTLVSGKGLRSTDGGQSWQDIKPFPDVASQGWRHEMLALRNGSLLASQIVGPDPGGERINFIVGRADGQSWDVAHPVEFYDPGRPIGGRACPKTVELDDGTLGTIFYDIDKNQPGGPGVFFRRTPTARLSAAAHKPVEYRGGVVVSVSEPGSSAGRNILQQGGSAVDAAVATAFALAVTHPAAGNIGGGGFMLVQPPAGTPLVFDYRETAPAAATANMFKKGESTYSHRAVGVPGTVRGLALAHQKFGRLSWKAVVAPACALAEEGFLLDAHHADSLNRILRAEPGFPEMRRVFGRADGNPWKAGERLVQPDLARTLRLIAEEGPDAFYRGSIAQQIAAEMKAGGGLITLDDLGGYQARVRAPIRGSYRGHDIIGAPPPSSGGTCLVEMLNILENFDLKRHGRWTAETLHLMIEAMRRAYCDRARYLGDPAFTEIPAELTTKEYARSLAAGIAAAKATPSEALAPELTLAPEGDSTTHFSVIDRDGLAVSNTYTLEHSYGSRIVVKGAGFLLNNEMSDFNWFPGVTTRTGLIGTAPNLIAPGKRMLSSQTPTIVSKDGKVLLITGSPGGRTIINTVLGIVVSVIDYGMPVQEAVDAPRLHHPWLPDEARLERVDPQSEILQRLRALGHRAVAGPRQGDAHSIWINPATGGYVGAADHRLSGAVAGY